MYTTYVRCVHGDYCAVSSFRRIFFCNWRLRANFIYVFVLFFPFNRYIIIHITFYFNVIFESSPPTMFRLFYCFSLIEYRISSIFTRPHLLGAEWKRNGPLLITGRRIAVVINLDRVRPKKYSFSRRILNATCWSGLKFKILTRIIRWWLFLFYYIIALCIVSNVPRHKYYLF